MLKKSKQKILLGLMVVALFFVTASAVKAEAAYVCECTNGDAIAYDSQTRCDISCTSECASRASSPKSSTCGYQDELWYVCKCVNSNYSSYDNRSVCLGTCESYCTARGINSNPEADTCQLTVDLGGDSNFTYRCTCTTEDYRTFRLDDTCEDVCDTFCRVSGGTKVAGSCVGDGGGGGDYSCGAKGEICNPVGITDVPTLIGKMIRAVLGIIGSLALLMFIYGGFVWMTARGNKEKVAQAQKVIIWAALGLMVIFASYIVLEFVFSQLI